MSSADSYYFDISLTSAAASNYTLEKVVLRVAGNSTGTTKYTAPLFYSTSSTFDVNNVAGVMDIAYTGYDNSCDDNEYIFPEETKSCRLYRRAKYTKPNGEEPGKVGTGSNYSCSNQTLHITYLEVYLKSSAPATTYTVTYKANGGSGTMENTTNTVADCEFTYSGKDFVEWNTKADGTGESYAPGDNATKDLDLYAIWTDHVAKYTLVYRVDGVEVGNELVNVSGTPVGIANPTKDCYTFAGWNPALADVTGTDGATVYVDATWTANYSTSATLISDDVVSGKPNVNTVLAASNIVSSITFAASQYEFTSNTTKPGYYGYKVNTANDKITLLIEQGKRVKVLFGSLKNVPTIKVNNVSKSLDADKAEGNTAENTFTYTASGEDALVSITFGSGTSTLKKVDIVQLYTATRVDAKSDGAGSDPNVAETTLPTPTAVSGWTFTGWIANQDVKDGDETKNAETILPAGTYTLLANTTFTAQWAATYTVIYDLNGGIGTVPTQAALVAGEKFTVADVDGITIPDGKAFAGWSDGANTYAAGSEYTMPASNVTFTAQWTDDNNVARIGDTYYTNLDDAVAYANENADAEIVLLKDIDRADRITLTKSTTINLNGNKLSKTDGGWLIFVKEGATLTVNGETENSAIHGGISLGAMTNNNGSLVINGGTYTCADGVACVHVNGTCLESNVTINGANLKSPKDIAVQLNGKGAYTITNATITGATGVYIKSGELTVTNSTIKGTKTPADYSYTGNGANATGDAIVVDACDYPGGAPTLNIISGTFEGTKGAVGNYNYNETSEPAIGGIQGGTFNTEVPAVLCADGYIPVKNGENNYGVTKTAKTFSLEDLVTTKGTEADYKEYLNNLGWSVANANALDNLNTEKDYDNYPYLGLKFKSAAGYVEGVVEGDKLLTIQLGHMAADADLYENGTKKVSLSGKDAETAAVHYYYVENQSTIKLQMTNDGTCVLKAVTITDPFTVTFNANGGDDIAAVQGKPSITLPEPTNGIMNFKGWYDAATEGNKIGDAGEEYTPTADVTIYAQWEALSTINTLSDLQVDGVTVDGFSSDVHTYNIVVPYGTDVANLPKITSATATNANANVVIWLDAPAWTDDFGGCYRQQANVTPQDPNAAVGYNDIRITIAPKDGVSIIKVATTGGENKTVTGLYAGDGDVNLSSNMKMDNGKYIGFTLAGTTLQVGDQINVHTTEASTTGDSHIIFYDNMTDKKELYETGEIGVVGDNIFTINAAMVGSTSAYVYRANTDNAHKWNGYIDFIEVLRPMNPVLTAITFDGTAAEMGVGNTFSVTLQNGTDLNAMTVVPTIVKNGEGGSAAPLVAWAWGENTYRVTDKDGDYTDYTITLTEAASPSAAPVITTQPADGNYIEGETITALKVVATGSGELSYQWYLGAEAIDGATAATYTPTVDAIGLYVYHCVVTNTEAGHPATSLVSSDATITIAEDPAAIKLLNDAGAINTTDFITGVSANTVNFNDAVHNCATFGSTASTVVGASGLNKYIIYNSKTTQTKIKFVLYNVQNASVTMKLQKLVEGGTEMEEVVINVPSKEVFTTDFYTFDGSANRTMYAFVQNTGIKVLQVKVIDNGTPLKQFGEVGYSINFNKGRLFLASGNEIAYDGLTYNASSNYAPLNNEGLSLASSKSYRFEVPADVTMTVTAANNKKYYITDKEDGSDNETAAAEARSFDLTAGAWYLRVDGSNLGLTKIEFTAPKCEVPVFNALANSDICSGDPYVELDGTATVSDGGTVTYKWYAEGGTEVLAETATYAPTADGSYYVVATNSLAGYTDNVVQSEVVTVTTHTGAVITVAPENVRMDAGETATLAVVATGKNVTYQWYICEADGTNATEIGATAASCEVTVGTGVQYYKVVVSSYCGAPVEAVVKVEEWTELPQANVTESITWDFSKAVTAETALPTEDAEIVLANVSGVALNSEFESNKLKVAGTRLRATYIQAKKLMFHATIPGKVTIEFSNTGDKDYDRILYVNGVETTAKSKNQTHVTYSIVVPAGDVVIQAWEKAAQPEDEKWNLLNIYSLSFTTADYTRLGLTVGSLGTICLPSNVPAGHAFGATFYKLVGKEPQYGKIVFEEVKDGLEAGKPYLFQAQSDVLYCFYGTENETNPDNSGAMKGTFVNLTLTELSNIYYFAQKALWSCVDLTSLSVPANRAYVKMDEMPAISEPNPAPGVRRITLGVNGQNTATGVENIGTSEQPMKMIIDGQLYIIRGEKMYDAQGKLVK